eukprot:TRINITY_DN5067_c0_g1_i1.p1 TRINITY_DN5067_c0_g1~~TRINITY_DN5067_c0_g1_i1.p1  ORF type:complete len:1197 (-),score=218.72 TRINITY_DN5067_c0_g1_i1:53-3643(-)
MVGDDPRRLPSAQAHEKAADPSSSIVPEVYSTDDAKPKAWACSQMAWFIAGIALAFMAITLIGAFAARVMNTAQSAGSGVNVSADTSNVQENSLTKVGELFPTIIVDKPAADTRNYQYATLANGLKVVNVQDTSTTQAAYSVGVDAGSLDDPEELPGLAHFCEHMLFLGTKKYPEPSGFDKFIGEAGGYNNAYTAEEHTVYYAEVAVSSADETLSRFADFFRAPLFNETYVAKEVQAIDSEHAKNVQDQDRRVFEIFSSLTNPKSPLNMFGTGNVETLETRPKQKGLDPVAELKAWFKAHYCPSRMRLATFGPQSLDQQLMGASKEFGDIPAGSPECQKPRRSWADPPPWTKAQLGKLIAIQGITPQSEMWIHFPLPDLQAYFKSNPVHYMNYVISYGGERSLSRLLQDSLGVIGRLSFIGYGGSYGYDLFVVVRLTEAGRSHYEQVLDVIFAYLAKLSSVGVDESLYTSLANVSKLEWNWSAAEKPANTVSGLAESMFSLPPKDLLSGNSRIDEVNTTLVQSLLKLMRPGNMNIAVVDPNANSTLFQGNNVQTLEHYGAEFTVAELASQLPGAKQRWQAWLDAGAAGGDSVKAALNGLIESLKKAKLYNTSYVEPMIPMKIEGVPSSLNTGNMEAAPAKDFAVVEKLFGQSPTRLGDKPVAVGKNTKDTNDVEDPQLWYRSGWVAKSPKVDLTLDLTVPRGPDSWEVPALDSLRLQLYGSLIGEEITPKMYDLSMTGVNYDIGFSPHTITFSFSGFAPMIPTLMDRVLAEFDRGVNVSDLARYNRLVTKVKQNLATYSDMPSSYAMADRTLLIMPGMRSREEQLQALTHVTAKSVASSVEDLLLPKKLATTALVMGNIDQESSEAAIMKIYHRVQGWPGANASLGKDEQVRRFTPVVKPSKPLEVRRLNQRPGDPNDAVVLTFLVGVSTVESRVILALISSVLQNVAYTELRTNRQLGYVVDAGVSPLSNVQFMSAIVQGDKQKADDVEGAIQYVYMDLMPNTLKIMSDAEFTAHCKSLEQELLQPPTTIDEEQSHFWHTISEGGDCVKLKDEMYEFLKSGEVTKETLVKTYNDIVFPKEGVRTKIMVKHFADRVPPRPTKAESRVIWKKNGVPDSAFSLLEKEYDATMVLEKATSEDRMAVIKDGSYYPTDLHCTRAKPQTGAALAKDGAAVSLVERGVREGTLVADEYLSGSY